MSQSKRKRTPYSQLSQEQKDHINATKRAWRSGKKNSQHDLFPVEIEGEISAQDGANSSLFSTNFPRHSHAHQQIFPQHTLLPQENAGSSALPSSSCSDGPCMLFDISIDLTVGNLMGAPTIQRRPTPTEPFTLPSMQDCKFCGAIKFPYETQKFCCSGGDVSLYPIFIPQELQQLYSGSGTDSANFLQYIKPYNDIFAFTSMGVHLDPVYAKRTNGIYTFRAQGQIYHLLDSLYPAGQMPSYLQLYFYDTNNEVTNRRGKKDKLLLHIIAQLIDVLKANPYSQLFRSLSQVPNIDEYEIRLRANPEIQDQTALPPAVSQVGAIWIEDEEVDELRERDIVVQKHNGHSKRISYYFGCYDPLQYPLLFPLGEPGWHEGIPSCLPKGGLAYWMNHFLEILKCPSFMW